MLVYIVFEFDTYKNTQYVSKVFSNAQDASDYCKEMSKTFWGVHYEYESYEVH